MKNQIPTTEVAVITEEELTESVKTTLAVYKPEQKKDLLAKAATLTQNIDVFNPESIRMFGNEAQKKLGNFSDAALSEMKSKDSGALGGMINGLLVELKDVDVNKLSPTALSKIPVVGKFFGGVKAFFTKYESVKANIDDITVKLEGMKNKIIRDNVGLQNLYKQNLEYIFDLDAHMIAGNEILETLVNTDETNLTPEQIKDKSDQIERLKKKLYNIYLLKAIAEQNLPQIRMIHKFNELEIDKTEQAVDTVIPLWKNQMTIALALRSQAIASGINKKVTDTTNEILERNAKQLKENAVQIARESERGVVDVKAIQNSTNDLIQTLKDVQRIKQEGDQARIRSFDEIGRLRLNMVQQVKALAETASK